MTDIISLWSNIVDPYINTTDAICAGHKIIECAEIGYYFEVFPLCRAAGQIGLIKEGKTGSFKVTSIINWSPQPKGLPGQGSIRKQLCCCAQSLGSQKTTYILYFQTESNILVQHGFYFCTSGHQSFQFDILEHSILSWSTQTTTKLIALPDCLPLFWR